MLFPYGAPILDETVKTLQIGEYDEENFLSAFAAIALIGTAATGVTIADGGADSDHQRGHQGQGMMGHGTSMDMGMGKTLMTEEERKGFRKAMHDAETQEERQEVRKSMRETMKQRAKEKGI